MDRKLIMATAAALLLAVTNLKAQLSAETEGITIKNGTIFSSEGLVLQPSVDLVLDNLLAEKSATAVTSASRNSVSRVYHFSRAINLSGTLGFFYEDEELNGNTAASLALFYKNQFGDNIYTSPVGNTSDIPNRYVSQSLSNTTLSHITAADGLVTLPVNLTDFTAIAENNRAKISWKTITEQNSHHYLVERSDDGHSFFPFAAVVEAKGTLNQTSNYLLYDDAPLNGNNYYRLTQFDINGTSYAYGVKQVSFKINAAASITVFPNPVTGNTIHVKLDNHPGKEVILSLVDISGKNLYEKAFLYTTDKNVYSLQLNTKPAAGQYILYVKGAGLNEKVKLMVL